MGWILGLEIIIYWILTLKGCFLIIYHDPASAHKGSWSYESGQGGTANGAQEMDKEQSLTNTVSDDLKKRGSRSEMQKQQL